MARRHKEVVISAEGRDQNKVFKITEMPAAQAEKWAARALLALISSGATIPDSVAQAGLAGVASVGMGAFAGLKWEIMEPLLDEMMQCVQVVPSPGIVRPLIESADDIEEVSTRFTLRKEVLELHLGFSLADKFSTLAGSAKATGISSPPSTSPM